MLLGTLRKYLALLVLTGGLSCGGRTAIDDSAAAGATSGRSSSAPAGANALTGGSGLGFGGAINPLPPLGQHILFDAIYRSNTPYNRYEGIYLTRDGDVMAFDYYDAHARTDDVPVVGSTVAAVDMLAQYGSQPKLIRHVDQVTLFDQFALGQSMAAALVVQSRTASQNEELSIKAWAYNEATQFYAGLRLWGCGDFLLLTLAQSASTLVDWLCGMAGSSLPMCCSTQVVPLASPTCDQCSSTGDICLSDSSGLKYCSTWYHCSGGCDCEPVCAGGASYCHDGGQAGLYCAN